MSTESMDPKDIHFLVQPKHLLLRPFLWSGVSLFALVDLSVLRFLPWLATDECIKLDGYPTMEVFKVVTGLNLIKSVFGALFFSADRFDAQA